MNHFVAHQHNAVEMSQWEEEKGVHPEARDSPVGSGSPVQTRSHRRWHTPTAGERPGRRTG
ncbi:hypothetical protein [Salinispora arenicola]|uniref:hypothetical protein n=1 Tax=Salinispora arenicola TaxID=168697 RepID=UPI0039B010B1